MNITILGAESLGARSLCVFVETSWGNVLIDPGVALSPHRWSKPPHPLEFAASRLTRKKITQAAAISDTIVISHYHFDHYTPFIPRIFGFSDEHIAAELYHGKRLLVKARSHHINFSQKKRSYHLFKREDLNPIEADGGTFDDLTFSKPFFHGEYKSKRGFVTMVMVIDGDERFIYGSDIQCLTDRPINWIIEQQPETVIVSGPPIYLKVITEEDKSFAKEQLVRLADSIPVTIVDHHLTRDEDFTEFLLPIRETADKHDHQVLTAAEYNAQPNLPLEARRLQLYKQHPIDDDWHDRFFKQDPEVLAGLDHWEQQLQTLENIS